MRKFSDSNIIVTFNYKKTAFVFKLAKPSLKTSLEVKYETPQYGRPILHHPDERLASKTLPAPQLADPDFLQKLTETMDNFIKKICPYCKRRNNCSRAGYVENPFCKHCLNDRLIEASTMAILQNIQNEQN